MQIIDIFVKGLLSVLCVVNVLLLLLQNLKSHAVTMFEVGKLSDESLDSFLVELEKVCYQGNVSGYFSGILVYLYTTHKTEGLQMFYQSQICSNLNVWLY